MASLIVRACGAFKALTSVPCDRSVPRTQQIIGLGSGPVKLPPHKHLAVRVIRTLLHTQSVKTEEKKIKAH